MKTQTEMTNQAEMETHTRMIPTPFIPISELMQHTREPSLPVAQDLNGQSIDWYTFEQDVTQLHHHLSQSPAKRWAICCDNSYWFAVAFMAACHASKHVIIPGNLQPAALAELSQHFDAVLYDPGIEVGMFISHQTLALPLDKTTDSNSSDRFNNSVEFKTLSHVDITLFTSGSSGQPKAIYKPLAMLEREVAQLNATWGESLQGTLTASTVSHQHIYGLLFRILWPLSAGRPFYCLDWQYPEQILQHADDSTILISSPALLKRLQPYSSPNKLRAIFSSGGPLPFDAAQHCHTLFGLYPNEVLGSTETGGIAHRQQAHMNQPWKAFLGTKITQNAEGCLRILSPLLYDHLSDSNDWYQTADQCELLDDSHFLLKGRADRVIKIEEKRISLTEIEQRLQQLPHIEEAAVIPYQDSSRLITAAALTLTADGQQTLSELGKGRFVLMLRQQLRQWIEPVGIPRRIRILDEIPLNTQGKRLISDIEQLFTSAGNQ
nr:AMP-binding protein [Vibrio gangliei]